MNAIRFWFCSLVLGIAGASMLGPGSAAFADELHLKQLKEFIESTRKETGKAANWKDLFRFADKHQIDILKSLQPVEAKELFGLLRSIQRQSPVSQDELLELLTAKEQSIVSWKATARIRRKYAPAAQVRRLPREQTTRFLMADGRDLVEQDSVAEGEDLAAHLVMTHADGIQRVFHKQPATDPQGAPSGRRVAVIDRHRDYSMLSLYLQPGNVIGESLLVPSERFGQSKEGASVDVTSVLKQLGILLEGEHLIEGAKCLCVATGYSDLYLDIENGFSLRKLEMRPQFQSSKVSFTKLCRKFVDCGDGVWLPSEIVKTWFDDAGQMMMQEQIDLSQMAINMPVPQETFTEIIPRGAFVNDNIKSLSYISGEKGSIAQLVEKSVPGGLEARPGKQSWTIVILGNLAVLAVVLAVWWRAKRVPAKQGAR